MKSLTKAPLSWLAAAAVAAGFAGCALLPSSPPAPAPAPPPAVAKPAPARVAPPATHHSEAEWRRALAQHIQTVNRQRIFEGRPPHPLKAVVVLELTVAADGRIEQASVLRAPQHARELGTEAVKTAQAASPGPPPPKAMVSRGPVRLTETWLFRQDNLFQLRTLAQEQIIQ